MSKWIGKFLRNEPHKRTDNTDKPHHEGHLSVLSVPPQGVLDLDFGNILERRPDNTDRFELDANMSGSSDPDDDLSGNPDLLYEYEERIAIAEYDGHQNPTQAKRIAYQDAFIAVLNTLPYEETEGDWLKHRIKAAQEWLFFQGLEQPE